LVSGSVRFEVWLVVVGVSCIFVIALLILDWTSVYLCFLVCKPWIFSVDSVLNLLTVWLLVTYMLIFLFQVLINANFLPGNALELVNYSIAIVFVLWMQFCFGFWESRFYKWHLWNQILLLNTNTSLYICFMFRLCLFLWKVLYRTENVMFLRESREIF
jgi:hypothetical protein